MTDLPDDPHAEYQGLTAEQLGDLHRLRHDLAQRDVHGPGAPGLADRIAQTRQRLAASGIPLEDLPQ